ncbi:amino acid ABC transporter substrate-binding protein [Pseudaquabacterium terrae]|uniref:amino acid ABC transporter substrate-binding protein n=1 Tax=Pseudaquabacterium terrae TaxID=2732868 RepID=UPI003CCC949C
MRRRVLALTAVAGCALWAGPLAAADAPADSFTLRKIREVGVISIGYREASVPFSYLDEQQRPVGYSMAICDHVVQAVKARLGLRELESRYVPVSSATRIPLVSNGSVDLECGVTTNNIERQRKVAFSVTTFVAASKLLSKKTQPVARIDDLRGKAVTSTVGTTSLRYLQELADERGIAMRIIAAKDDAEAFRLVETGRAAAYAMDDVLLRGTIAAARKPDDYMVSDEALSVEPYGIMLNRDDPEFKRLVDDTIVGLFKSGEIHRLYRRWFQSQIPGGINLALPMHPAMRRVVDKPTDSGDPAHYR